MRALLICKKTKPYLKKTRHFVKDDDEQYYYVDNTNILESPIFNGKILIECDYYVEEIRPEKYWHSTEDFDYIYNTGTIYYEDLLKKSCLMDYELDDYLGCEDKGYAIHIKNLHIFDKPRELSECHYLTLEKGFLRQIKKSPSNMCYALTTRYDKDILILVSPQEMCRIANGEQTTLVRKKVLKEML